MKIRLAALALTASLLTAGCSEGLENDQITEVPPKQENTSDPSSQEGQPSSSPARVELPEVPAPAAEDKVLDEVLDNTGE